MSLNKDVIKLHKKKEKKRNTITLGKATHNVSTVTDNAYE